MKRRRDGREEEGGDAGGADAHKRTYDAGDAERQDQHAEGNADEAHAVGPRPPAHHACSCAHARTALKPPSLCRASRGAASSTREKCYELARLPNKLFKDTEAVGGPQSAAAVKLLQLGFARTAPKTTAKAPRGKVDILWCVLEKGEWSSITR